MPASIIANDSMYTTHPTFQGGQYSLTRTHVARSPVLWSIRKIMFIVGMSCLIHTRYSIQRKIISKFVHFICIQSPFHASPAPPPTQNQHSPLPSPVMFKSALPFSAATSCEECLGEVPPRFLRRLESGLENRRTSCEGEVGLTKMGKIACLA
ncbi:hypothetical protein BJ165DRAFT_1478983 [Panaeolus papilionaceus]|nr:hypothetical protein BJ165DRAFT_1478983 [Panaeolus papilionaceus]